jgi:predicted nucleic acid-binding protein
MLFDTDVLIHARKGHEGALRLLQAAPRRCMALQTAMELLQGSRDMADLRLAQRFLTESNFEVLALSPNIGHRALIYIEAYALAHGMRSGDALIAATAMEHNLKLCTGNVRHFKPVKNLKLHPFKP